MGTNSFVNEMVAHPPGFDKALRILKNDISLKVSLYILSKYKGLSETTGARALVFRIQVRIQF